MTANGSDPDRAFPFRVLDARKPVDRLSWLRQWRAWPDREVHAHPDYVMLFAGPDDQALCATASSGVGGALFPFILRPLAALDWASAETTWDLTTPYGYAGPFQWQLAAAPAELFWSQLAGWLRQQQVISAFVRMTLFNDSLLLPPWQIRQVAPNVVCDLRRPAAAIWSAYGHKVRKNVQRARSCGLTVRFDDEGRCLPQFIEIYRRTLERRAAGSEYWFSETFFERFATDLRGHYVLCMVYEGRTAVSCELVLVGARRAYSFLGGTEAYSFPMRPNDLLKHEVIHWAAETGLEHYVLGGGVAGEDGIFRYKREFSPTGVVPFSVATAVLDPPAYERILTRRFPPGSDERARAVAGGFFPAYRGEREAPPDPGRNVP